MNTLLARQLKRSLRRDKIDVSSLPEEWQTFIALVEQAYSDSDSDRAMVQRSIDIAHAELFGRNQQLLLQNEKLLSAEQQLLQSRDELEQRVADRTSELRNAKDAADTIREHFQLLLDSTGEGIYGIDNQGLCTFVNVGAAQLLGYGLDEMIGRNMHELIHYNHADGSPHPVEQCPIFRSFQTEQSCTVHEDVFWCRDGKPVPVQYSAHPMRDASRIVGSVIAFSDISARKAVESELRLAKEAAERASQAKSEFLAKMSHEIRTPLNGVIGMIDQLVNTDLTDDQQRYTTLARTAAESLMAVINDILDFSKIEAGQVEIESVEFDPRRLVNDLVDLFTPVAAKRQLTLTGTLQPDLPHRLRGDSNRIRQVLVNLLGNAVKFTSGGSVEVRVTAQSQGPGSCVVRAEVADTGIGIPPDRLDRLFKSFSQVDASITRQFGGTGLGLAICKRLIELMGGQIGVRSEPGRGTTFWLTIPLAVPADGGASAAEERGRSASSAKQELASLMEAIKGLHLLVAEDNEINQFVTQKTLERAGCTCDIAANGALAVEAFARRPYDAILMDCQMPNVDGLEATRRIRRLEAAAPGSRRIPIIALTAEAISGDRERCLSAGMDGYITKPLHPREVFAQIAALANDRPGQIAHHVVSQPGVKSV